jgi:hypothetical protein
MGLRDFIDLARKGNTARKGINQFEKDHKAMTPNYDPFKSLKAGVLQVLTLLQAAVLTAIADAIYRFFSDESAIKAVLEKADVNHAYAAVILMGCAAIARVVQNWTKHSPTAKKITGAGPLALVAFALLPAPARAEEPLFQWLKQHGSITSGTLIVDKAKHTLVEIRFVDDFEIKGSLRGVARVALFSLARDGQPQVTAGIPTSLEDVKAYSDGELWFGLYKQLHPNVAIECLGGVQVKMPALFGNTDDPLDGTKLAGGCGPRFRHGNAHASVLLGHYGSVLDGERLAGFAPSVLIHAYIPMPFLGSNWALAPDLAFGGAPPEPGQEHRRITRSLRLVVSKSFR